MIKAKNTLNGKLNVSVVKEYPELEEITITPTLGGQELEPSKYGYSKITINAIPAQDITITPTTENQKQEGIFKTVTVNAIEGEELNLNPSEEQQNFEGVFLGVNINPIQVQEITTDLDFSVSDAMEVTAQEGTYIKKTIINKPSNLSPENIKSGETVCGISGTNADTSDADATSNDIAAGKTAYVNNEKITGAMEVNDCNVLCATDVPKGESNKYSGISLAIKKVTGEYKVPDARYLFCNCMNLEEITATLDTTGAIYFNSMFEQCNSLTSVPLFDTSTGRSVANMFKACINLTSVPLFDFSSATSVSYVFMSCRKLEDVPQFNIPNVTGSMISMFFDCNSLTSESLNNILGMCTSATKYTGTKTLKELGLTSAQATTCTGLTNYSAFTSAGWTTGY